MKNKSPDDGGGAASIGRGFSVDDPEPSRDLGPLGLLSDQDHKEIDRGIDELDDKIEGAIAEGQPPKSPNLEQARAKIRSQLAAAARPDPPSRGDVPGTSTGAATVALRQVLRRSGAAGVSKPEPAPEKETVEEIVERYKTKSSEGAPAKPSPTAENVSLAKAANTVQAIKRGLKEGAPGASSPSELRAGTCFQLFARARRLSAIAARQLALDVATQLSVEDRIGFVQLIAEIDADLAQEIVSHVLQVKGEVEVGQSSKSPNASVQAQGDEGSGALINEVGQGSVPERGSRKRGRATLGQKKVALELMGRSMSTRQVAEKLGIPKSTVARWRKQAWKLETGNSGSSQ